MKQYSFFSTKYSRTRGFRALMFAVCLAVPGFSAHAAESAPATVLDSDALPAYQRVGGISGNLSSVGSDTLANLMTLWSEEFQRIYPNVNIQVQAAGSSTAPIALTERTANLGPMSRAMKASERKAFEERYGYPPTAVPVAIDALAVFVHRDNPIDGLSIPELDAVFSATRRCSAGAGINSWQQLGLDGLWSQQRIQLFGRNSVSGTYGFFKEAGLCGGDFRNNVNEQPGSGSVVQSVSTSLNAIGYSGIGFRTSGVKALALAEERGGPLVEASPENVSSGRYPLSRFLLVYVNKQPNEPLPPLEREFLRVVLSATGQDIVRRDGYIPLPPSVALSTLYQLGIQP